MASSAVSVCGPNLTARFIMLLNLGAMSIMLMMSSRLIVRGFNIDVRTASLRRGEDGSMFGFTVAQHVDRGQNW